MKPLSLDELTSWEDHGAMWRLVRADERTAVVELCTCYGEPVDVREGDDPGLIAMVTARGSSSGDRAEGE